MSYETTPRLVELSSEQGSVAPLPPTAFEVLEYAEQREQGFLLDGELREQIARIPPRTAVEVLGASSYMRPDDPSRGTVMDREQLLRIASFFTHGDPIHISPGDPALRERVQQQTIGAFLGNPVGRDIFSFSTALQKLEEDYRTSPSLRQRFDERGIVFESFLKTAQLLKGVAYAEQTACFTTASDMWRKEQEQAKIYTARITPEQRVLEQEKRFTAAAAARSGVLAYTGLSEAQIATKNIEYDLHHLPPLFPGDMPNQEGLEHYLLGNKRRLALPLNFRDDVFDMAPATQEKLDNELGSRGIYEVIGIFEPGEFPTVTSHHTELVEARMHTRDHNITAHENSRPPLPRWMAGKAHAEIDNQIRREQDAVAEMLARFPNPKDLKLGDLIVTESSDTGVFFMTYSIPVYNRGPGDGRMHNTLFSQRSREGSPLEVCFVLPRTDACSPEILTDILHRNPGYARQLLQEIIRAQNPHPDHEMAKLARVLKTSAETWKEPHSAIVHNGATRLTSIEDARAKGEIVPYTHTEASAA